MSRYPDAQTHQRTHHLTQLMPRRQGRGSADAGFLGRTDGTAPLLPKNGAVSPKTLPKRRSSHDGNMERNELSLLRSKCKSSLELCGNQCGRSRCF
jgi:hypothetical protein